MKKVICMIVLSSFLFILCNVSSASGEWKKGVVTEVTDTTITVNGETYDIDSKTVVKDTMGHSLSADILLQKTCCNNIRFFVKDDRYIEKIIVDTSKAVM